MTENILFTLVDQYGNSLENFKFDGKFTFLYSYPNKKPEPVFEGRLDLGIAYGEVPEPDKGLEYTQLIIEFESKFYYAPAPLEYKGEFTSPQTIVVAKRPLDPEAKYDILKRASEKLNEAVAQRIGGGAKEL